MEIKSRVPGKIVRFEKQVGDTVAVKDVLVVMEAMKMKQLVPSPVAGVVTEYKVAPGDRVSAGAVLAIIE
ncbi:MAG: acetyl-CoA carboxylase biotin carboxyl carrier protein subunit [Acidaminococcaceae bacterium]